MLWKETKDTFKEEKEESQCNNSHVTEVKNFPSKLLKLKRFSVKK